MGYKLGKEQGVRFDRGTAINKLSFGSKHKNTAIPGNPIEYIPMPPNERGVADINGTIYINENLKGTRQHDITLNHEMVHMTEMKLGKLSYDTNCVTYNGVKYPRDGQMVKVNNKWYQLGDKKNLPWEKQAHI